MMKIRLAFTGGVIAAFALLSTSCYNNPEVSLRQPGAGPAHIHSGPSVGPGTTAGGSTAGPQPAPHHEGEHTVEPQPGGVHPSSSAEPPMQPATPVHEPGGNQTTPSMGKEQTGNEQGHGRGHEPQLSADPQQQHGTGRK